MQGTAQKKFSEITHQFPFQQSKKYLPRQPWPLIEKLLDKGNLAYVDFALAEKLLRNEPNASEAVASLICHLSMAVRQGHLCISCDGKNVTPHPSELWLKFWNEKNCEETQSLSDDISSELEKLIVQGFNHLPCDLVKQVSAGEESRGKFFCRQGNLLYFEKYWNSEVRFIQHWRRLENATPSIPLDYDSIRSVTEGLQKLGKLLPEQSQAIISACHSSCILLCGGPGTGKTYTAGQMIKIILETLSIENRKRFKIEIAAPTGKAAANLQNSLTQAIHSLSDFPSIIGKTLHALLGIDRLTGKRKSQSYLKADLVIVDESSMIDVHLMTHLMASLKTGTRLILLGDPHQLPPVAAGMLFRDLVEFLAKNVITLYKCIRTDLAPIVNFAEAVNKGNDTQALHCVHQDNTQSVQFVNETDPKKIHQLLLERASPFFEIYPLENSDELFHYFNRFRILSPFRKGPLGVEMVNQLIYQQAIKSCKSSFVAPIILTSSDSRLKLFNGEVGLIIRSQNDGKHGEGDYTEVDSKFGFGQRESPRDSTHRKSPNISNMRRFAMIESQGFGAVQNPSFESTSVYAYFKNSEGDLKQIPALLLPSFEYAYCLSVHKSQGSEFDHVIILMPEGTQVFGREVIYTAVTRARKKLEMWGTENILKETLKKCSKRLSGINSGNII